MMFTIQGTWQRFAVFGVSILAALIADQLGSHDLSAACIGFAAGAGVLGQKEGAS